MFGISPKSSAVVGDENQLSGTLFKVSVSGCSPIISQRNSLTKSQRNSQSNVDTEDDLYKLEVGALVKDLDDEIEELERDVVYWQTLFEESQKEAASLRSRNRELEAELQFAYSDHPDRPRYIDPSEITAASGTYVGMNPGWTASKGWSFFGNNMHTLSNPLNRNN
jgi:TolA-binding protein